MAEGLYTAVGFRDLGRILEYTPTDLRDVQTDEPHGSRRSAEPGQPRELERAGCRRAPALKDVELGWHTAQSLDLFRVGSVGEGSALSPSGCFTLARPSDAEQIAIR